MKACIHLDQIRLTQVGVTKITLNQVFYHPGNKNPGHGCSSEDYLLWDSGDVICFDDGRKIVINANVDDVDIFVDDELALVANIQDGKIVVKQMEIQDGKLLI